VNFPPGDAVRRLLDWFRREAVVHPWDPDRADAWGIWVSEVMLQQTTVAAVRPRYERWMARFPDPRSLAAASEDEVLREWEGLGYYNRVRNLASAASEVTDTYGGDIPRSAAELRRLPGVGDYIAAAVASFAFGEPAAAVEANGRRLAMRLTGRDSWSAELDRSFRSWVEENMPRTRPGILNAAVMQLGQRVCTPRRPDCPACPLMPDCAARAEGREEAIPARRSRTTESKTTVLALCLNEGRTYLRRRSSGIGRGLWVFPAASDFDDRELGPAVERLPERLHAYTRFRETLDPRVYRIPDSTAAPWNGDDAGEWVLLAELGRRPMPTAYRRIADDLLEYACAGASESRIMEP